MAHQGAFPGICDGIDSGLNSSQFYMSSVLLCPFALSWFGICRARYESKHFFGRDAADMVRNAWLLSLAFGLHSSELRQLRERLLNVCAIFLPLAGAAQRK